MMSTAAIEDRGAGLPAPTNPEGFLPVKEFVQRGVGVGHGDVMRRHLVTVETKGGRLP